MTVRSLSFLLLGALLLALPVRAGDVSIDTVLNLNAWEVQSTEHVCIDDDTCYAFWLDNDKDINYRKSTNGGDTWGALVQLNNATFEKFRLWYDGWTDGDSGTVIHVAAMDSADDDVHCRVQLVQQRLHVGLAVGRQEVCVAAKRSSVGARYTIGHVRAVGLSLSQHRAELRRCDEHAQVRAP